jgi:hypothetical protein
VSLISSEASDEAAPRIVNKEIMIFNKALGDFILTFVLFVVGVIAPKI